MTASETPLYQNIVTVQHTFVDSDGIIIQLDPEKKNHAVYVLFSHLLNGCVTNTVGLCSVQCTGRPVSSCQSDTVIKMVEKTSVTV